MEWLDWESKVILAVREAGEAIEAVKVSGELGALSKEDMSPVTLADKRANEILCSCLKSLDMGQIISEEGEDFVLNEGNTWVVNPLDGTKDYISGSFDYTVNVALFEGTRLIWGVVLKPASSEIWMGRVSENVAFYSAPNQDWMRVKHQVRPRLSKGMRVLGSVKHPEKELPEFLARLDEPVLLQVGSSLKFCEIIMGRADCYPRWSHLMVWDLAAGMAVLLASGGQLTPMVGEGELEILKSDLRVPSFIAE